MEWILIVWLFSEPSTTGVITQPDEGTCMRTLSTWESISDDHTGLCVLGNMKEINLEEHRDTE